MPLDGVWLDDAWYFGGSSATVKQRNLTANPRAVLHLEDAMSAVIVEGACEKVVPDADLAELRSALSKGQVRLRAAAL